MNQFVVATTPTHTTIHPKSVGRTHHYLIQLICMVRSKSTMIRGFTIEDSGDDKNDPGRPPIVHSTATQNDGSNTPYRNDSPQ
jgi:hypothetical protein